jgi:hypothetical protein
MPLDLLECHVVAPAVARPRGRGRHPMEASSMAKRTCKFPGCEDPHKGHGWCNKHLKRYRIHGDPTMVGVGGNKPGVHLRPLEERFWAKVNKNGPIPEFRPDLGPCWLWTGWCDAKGYGRFTVDHRGRLAPRIAYELTNGPIPAGLVPDHLCRVPPCVRPSHLEPVTKAENMRRGLRGELTTHCPHGHPYDTANTYRDRKGSRRCRACNNERSRYPNRIRRRVQ